ncbi:MAG: RagB/SusD family nutrient uptake outer membrane protein [Flavobacteriaceae bacterium]|nr:RagB/SusD family nutrient uptake outer membrane protein [Flavobacteriaceae bacterium]
MALILALGGLLLGCEKALEPDYPNYLLSQDAIFEDTATIDAALADIYSGLRDNSPITGGRTGIAVLLGLYADELNYYSSSSETDNAFYNHTVLPNSSAVFNLWNTSYTLIFKVNSIIEGLHSSPLGEDEIDPYLGEALFLRAYLHFYLSQLYGDIPYIETTNYVQNASVSRMPLQQVYGKMENDLSLAKNLLPDMDNSGKRLRAAKGTASALLARLYLYNGQWEKAWTESNEVIATGNYILESDLNNVFLKESPSTIWQLKPEMDGYPTMEGQSFIFEFGPPSLYALTEDFITDFETGDLRKEVWTREISDGTESWYHAYKYKQNMFSGASSEYSIQFRVAEQYLIRAEASLHLDKLQEAQSDINVIRMRAGLQPTSANSPEELMDELMRQRRFEFFTEGGHRWFDIKRTGTAAEALQPIKTGWKETDVLLPLPQNELLLNPNLNPQNPGY